MALLTGRTNAKHIGVYISDADAGDLVDITPYTNSVGTVGLTNETTDVTAYSDGAKNVTIGQPTAPISLSGPFDTTVHTLFTGLTNGKKTDGSGLSLDIRIGIRAAWTTLGPQFGITSTAAIGYQLVSYNLSSALVWTAVLEPFGATAPAWGTAVETN